MSGLSVESKLEMSLDDVIQKDKEKKGNQGGRGGRGGQRGGQRGGNWRGRGGNRGRGDNRYMRNNNNRNRNQGYQPYGNPSASFKDEDRPSADDQWVHDKFDNKQKRNNNNRNNNVFIEADPHGPVKVEYEGLPWDVLQDDVKDIFSSYGNCNVTLNFDKADRSEGKGFVIFDNRADGEKAIAELDGALVNKAAISVSLGPNNGAVARKRNNNNFHKGKEEQREQLVISVNNDRMGGGGGNKKGRGPFRYGQ
mmetsp:Transcript_37591/g.59321  ORF Transcript_37591/g.59321 Transcript_37591/m.59321 type:complete len:252 (-) Transcript_37591:215-970(-)|eukprot:CAMPEP_0201513826 /NCGR_PEP_ID=MMETSP0161_2-20130828/5805_1 /ASSEMBLY_ACC=CAM_ASM_000251 /TAXON_ID=180227 /ORGANISM="Neoparamoeba aestuarina, Strain SoJaBio B1-5/56/2" /LENGTH=251 /DNA_ID=CAMNT_0047910193 /DNA_START=111 /DNA_END=866 /DNA_ORIENTATION=+